MTVDAEREDRIVTEYLERLDTALRPLPSARRRQLVDQIAEHVAEARAELPHPDEVAVRSLLDRVGQPEDIAAAALEADQDGVDRGRRGLVVGAVVAVAAATIAAVAVFALAGHRSTPAAPTRPRTIPTSSVPPTTVPTTTTAPPTATSTVPSDRTPLPPATVAPVVAECSQQLMYGADGSFGPLTCDAGEQLNVLAWNAAAALHPLIMSLGPDATPGQVNTALCADLPHSTIPIETDTYHMAAMYYGWSFGYDPTRALVGSPGMCG